MFQSLCLPSTEIKSMHHHECEDASVRYTGLPSVGSHFVIFRVVRDNQTSLLRLD